MLPALSLVAVLCTSAAIRYTYVLRAWSNQIVRLLHTLSTDQWLIQILLPFPPRYMPCASQADSGILEFCFHAPARDKISALFEREFLFNIQNWILENEMFKKSISMHEARAWGVKMSKFVSIFRYNSHTAVVVVVVVVTATTAKEEESVRTKIGKGKRRKIKNAKNVQTRDAVRTSTSTYIPFPGFQKKAF